MALPGIFTNGELFFPALHVLLTISTMYKIVLLLFASLDLEQIKKNEFIQL
jgi:hypothetical protein